jgi:hypothetical protein
VGTLAILAGRWRLVTVGEDYVLWDLDTGKLATLTELRGYRAGCDFSPLTAANCSPADSREKSESGISSAIH